MKFGEAVSATGTAQNATAADLTGDDKLGIWRVGIASPNQYWNITLDVLAEALATVADPDILKASDIGVSVQGWDAQLDLWSAVSPASYYTSAQVDAAFQPLDSLVTTDRTFPIRRLTLVDTDAGATAGPVLETYRNSTTPAVSDILGAWEVYGKDGAGNKTLYGKQEYTLADATNGSEDGQWGCFVSVNGTNTEAFRAAGQMVGDPANIDTLVGGQPAPNFAWHRGNVKLYARSLMVAEYADTPDFAIRRINGTPSVPLNLSVNDLIGVLYFQGYINGAWGGSSPNYARTFQISARYTDVNAGKSGGTGGFSIAKTNTDTLTLRAFFANDGKFALLGRGASEDGSADDTNFTPAGVLTALGGDVANDKVVSLRRANSTTNGLDVAFVDASSAVRIQALNAGTPITVGDIPYATGVISWATRHTNSAQPCFKGTLSATATNVTGDGTAYTIIWDVEQFDRASNFSTSTGAFTAPVTGIYQLNTFVQLEGVDAGHTRLTLKIVTGSTEHFLDWGDVTPDANARVGLSMAVTTQMTAAETATVVVIVSGATKVVDVFWGASGIVSSSFSGFLVA